MLPTGLMPRWYVFPRQIWHPRPSSWSTVIPFRVPWVPTGMKTGVLTMECGNMRSQALAFVTGHSATIRRVRGEAACRAFFSDMLFTGAFISAPCSTAAAMLVWTCDVTAVVDSQIDQWKCSSSSSTFNGCWHWRLAIGWWWRTRL